MQRILRTWVAFGLAAAMVGTSARAGACTVFSAKVEGAPIVAKSFDWSTGEGWIVVNERGRVRPRIVGGERSEAARFASISLTTAGPGLPISGMNEAGLVVEALVDGGVSASRTPDPAHLTGLELVQYGLDHFATAGELGDFAERHGIAQLAIPLHFFACDRSGACAVIESTATGVHVTRGAELARQVLANRPYASEVGAHASPRSDLVSSALRSSAPARVDDAFRLLEKVRIPNLTKWQVVWELGRGEAEVHAGGAAMTIHLDDARVRCEGAPRVRALGNREASFHAWSEADTAQAEKSVASQLGGSAQAARLARAALQAARGTSCASAL